jgi:peptide/nickel transport system ATP-binding protein/oligopeptide transport system ATP-binding protein
MRETHKTAVVLITHDLGVVAETADDVVVMYAGRVVEQASARDLFAKPLHPYTVGLFNSLPRVDRSVDRLEAIPGNVPSPTNFPTGCRFRARCPLAAAKCLEDPPLVEIERGHFSACWFASELAAGRKVDFSRKAAGDAPVGDAAGALVGAGPVAHPAPLAPSVEPPRTMGGRP